MMAVDKSLEILKASQRAWAIRYGRATDKDGYRPVEIMRSTPDLVLPFLDAGAAFKPVGEGGRKLMLPLPPQAVAPWRHLAEKDAWGKFSTSVMNRDWKKAMRRAGDAATRRRKAGNPHWSSRR